MPDPGTIDLPLAARVVDVVVENHRTKTFTLNMSLPGARPGQFVMVWLPGKDEKPISLMGADPVQLTVAAVGPFTGAMHSLRPGDRVWLRGPFGNGFSLEGNRVVLAGGGYGVAPLHFLARQVVARGVHVTAIVGARTRSDVLFEDRFRALGVETVIVTDDGSHGRRGLATDPLAEMLEDSSKRPDHVYACGPEPMLETVKSLCMKHGVPAQISWARVMRCAMGICGTCDRGGWLVCRDGPVERV